MQLIDPIEAQGRRVIAVDLDGTLVNSDTLYEQFAQLLFRSPKAIPGAVKALVQGRASLKAYVAERTDIDVAHLNYNQQLIDYLQAEKADGALIVLCTAADERIAISIANHHGGLFDAVHGTSGSKNLKGKEKAKFLKATYPNGFVYAGDSAADLDVWPDASEIILVGASQQTAQKAKALGKSIRADFSHNRGAVSVADITPVWQVWAKALRVHHWSKNILLFVPMILAHAWVDFDVLIASVYGFILLLAITSSSYLINDLADLDADRRHRSKRFRPLASGALSIQHGMAAALLVIPVALVLAFFLHPEFCIALFGYLIVTLAYSFGLKRIPLLDTLIIGGLFTSRLIMGGTLLDPALSIWLLTFSMFFFFSLATAKRHGEIVRMDESVTVQLNGRGYKAADAPLTLAMGIATAMASLIIFVLYLTDEAFTIVGYSRPEALWVVAMGISIWVGRVWLLTHRGEMLDDPVSFALSDRSSLAIGVIVALSFIVAI